MDRLLPRFFGLMVFAWMACVYYSSDIIMRIRKEEEIHHYLTQLRGKLKKVVEHYNSSSV
jgi:hypothetical protein